MVGKITLKLDAFDGPLDLLLGLIEEQKLEITEVSLSKITEQFLDFLDQQEDIDEVILADFLVVAAKLLLMKSRALIPQFSLEEEDGPTLEAQLKLYKAFVDASKKLNEKWLDTHRSVGRREPARKREGFFMPENVDRESMHKAFVKLVARLKPPKPLPKTQIDKAISMKEKIKAIRSILKSRKKVGFRETIGVTNKTDMIVGFLSLLELVKQQHVALHQDETFDDIIIERV